MEYIRLCWIILDNIEFRCLHGFEVGALVLETMGLIWQFSLCIFGRAYEEGIVVLIKVKGILWNVLSSSVSFLFFY